MIKVLAVIEAFVPPFVERTGLRVFAGLFEHLRRHECDLHILTTVPPHADPAWMTWVEDRQRADFHIHAHPEPFGAWPRLGLFASRLRLGAKIRKLHREHAFDIIHEFSSSPLLVNRTALASKNGTATIHSLTRRNESWLGNPRWCLMFPDLLLCGSRRTYLDLKARNPDAVVHQPLGVDLAMLRAPVIQSTLRDQLHPVILYIGSLEDRKGIDTLLRAAPLVLSRPEVRLIIATHACSLRGYDHATARKQLLHFVGQHRSQVKLREGSLDIPRLLADADVLVYPLSSMHGALNQPATLLDAMAAGKAVLASRLPEIEEIISNGVDGMLVPPGDADALAAQLVGLLDDATLRAKLGTNAARRAEAFDIEVCAQTLFKQYHWVLERKANKADS